MCEAVINRWQGRAGASARRLPTLLVQGVELVEDAGFEGALPFLARKAAALCREQAAAEARGGGGGSGRGRDLPAAPPATALRGLMFAAAANASAAAGGSSGKRGAAAAAAATAEPTLLAELRAAAAAGPSVAAAEERAAAERLAAGKGPVPLPPGNRWAGWQLRFVATGKPDAGW